MRHYKDWLQAYLEFTKNSEAPDVFHLWTGLSTIAGALRRKCYIHQGNFSWHSNMYIFLIAPPGVISKSTTVDIGMRLLKQVEGIHWGPSIMTWQGFVSAFQNSTEEFYDHQGGLAKMCAITTVASELGNFFDPKNAELVNLLVTLWDSRDVPLEKLTKGGGLEVVEKPWLNFIGCTTPSWIAENLNNYFGGGGLSSRTLYIYADTKRRFIAYPSQEKNFGDVERERLLVEDLQRIANISGNYTLTPEALDFGTTWYSEMHLNDHPFKHDERFQHYLARKQAHVHKAAMLRSASLRDETIITLTDLKWGIEQVTSLESNMVKAFGELPQEEIVKVQVKLLSILRERGKLKKQELYQKVMFAVGYETFNAALEALLGTGLIEMVQHSTGVFIEFVGEAVVQSLTEKQP